MFPLTLSRLAGKAESIAQPLRAALISRQSRRIFKKIEKVIKAVTGDRKAFSRCNLRNCVDRGGVKKR